MAGQFYLSIKREEWKVDTRNMVAWIIEGTGKMDPTVSVMPGNMDQKGGNLTKMDFKVSDMPGTMDQKGGGVTKRKYDLSSVDPEDRHSMR